MSRSAAPALLALLLALPAAVTAAQDSTDYLDWDPATRTVTFELIAGGEGASSPFNFNGYTDGEANLVVPPGVNVVMNFV
ncbi:MAG: sulfocyanin-like copper-binding protein, partial [Gemmatimonadales bacterium]